MSDELLGNPERGEIPTPDLLAGALRMVGEHLPMTREQARIVVLESAVRQAQATVSFLHGCLTDSRYKYSYPDQTEARLEEWEKLVPYGPTCPHSITDMECPGCQRRVAHMRLMQEALAVLNE